MTTISTQEEKDMTTISTPEEKIDRIRNIQSEIETNRTRLDNAEQSVQLYLNRLKELNDSIKTLLDE